MIWLNPEVFRYDCMNESRRKWMQYSLVPNLKVQIQGRWRYWSQILVVASSTGLCEGHLLFPSHGGYSRVIHNSMGLQSRVMLGLGWQTLANQSQAYWGDTCLEAWHTPVSVWETTSSNMEASGTHERLPGALHCEDGTMGHGSGNLRRKRHFFQAMASKW